MSLGILSRVAVSLLALALLSNASTPASPSQPAAGARSIPAEDRKRLDRFAAEVDELRESLEIPGVSAVILRDQKVLWAGGFGFADVKNGTPATADTLYSIASLTKPFAATLIMQLVEQGELDLDEPIARYSSEFQDDTVRIKHLISHTSHGTPGDSYQYDGSRFDYLTEVIEKKFGKPFVNVMVETFLDPLDMTASVPYHSIVKDRDKWAGSLGKERLDRYEKNLSALSRPYTLYGDREILDAPYPSEDYLDAAAGLLSTVADLARFDAAIDRHVFLKKETQERAWTPFVSNAGQRLPYGLGWFVTDYQGERLIWHYGHWGIGFSSIHLKLPERGLTLIMLANSEALSDHQFQVGDDIVNNVFACRFLQQFVFESESQRSQARDCEQASQTALAKWRDQRRAAARTAIELDSAQLDAVVGRYQYEEPGGRIFEIEREGDRLFVDIPKDHRSEMFAESELKFFLKIWKRQLVFSRRDGQVAHMELVTDDGQVYPAKRLR